MNTAIMINNPAAPALAYHLAESDRCSLDALDRRSHSTASVPLRCPGTLRFLAVLSFPSLLITGLTVHT